MPSLMLHLVIGEEYLKNNKGIKNAEEFLKGCLAPDFAKDKNKSHFGTKNNPKNFTQTILAKTDLYEICQNAKLDSDFNKGVFLHLVTDDFFYKTYMLKHMQSYEKIKQMSLDNAHKAIYEDYSCLAYYLCKTNPPQNTHLLSELAKQTKQQKMQYFTEKDIDNIIEAMSNIDLEQIQTETLKGGKNATKSKAI